MRNPLRNNLFVTSLNNSKNVLQNSRIDMRIIIRQKTFSSLCYPYFSCIRRRCTLRHMNVHRLQRNIFVRPEINPE